jgi:hypothetical protein
MSGRLSVTDALDSVQVYCYYAIQYDKYDVFDEEILFRGLNERVSRSMLRIVLKELRSSGRLETQLELDGSLVYRASMSLLQTVEGFLALRELSSAEWLDQNIGSKAATTGNVSSDTWEPLKNESNPSQKEDAISAIEDVVRHVEADNGFAVSRPEARNSLLYSLKVGVKMLKEYTPSREQVIANILKPLKYLGDLFTKHTIEELAKKASEKLLLWLSGS